MGDFRIAVLASGTGTNLQAILDQLHGRDGIEVVAVASDKPDAQALERAAGAGVETGVFPTGGYEDRTARDAAIGDWQLWTFDLEGKRVVRRERFAGRPRMGLVTSSP